MNIIIYNKQKKLVLSSSFIEKIVLSTLEDFSTPCSEVVIHLVGKKKISSLHQTYFQDPTPTDCISFPIEDSHCLGEIFVCPEVAIAYAKKHQKDPMHETALYIVHGLLHLLGYDDHTPSQIQKMRSLEKRTMKKLELTV